MNMNSAEILAKAEENVNILASIPFAERLEKSLAPQTETGKLVFLTESERIALEIGKELMKAYMGVSADDDDEEEETDDATDDGGFGADAEEQDDDAEGD